MARFKINISIALLAALLALSACSNKEEAAEAVSDAASEPAAAVMQQIQLLKAGDFDALAHASLPDADYKVMREEFTKRKNERSLEITDEQREKFEQQIKMLTVPDAEQQLMQRLQPVLDQYNTKYAAMLPMYIGIGQTMVMTSVNQSKTLSPDQKQQATQLMNAAAKWAQNADWGNPEKAKQAIAIITKTARQFGVKTLDEARSLTYEQAMKKYALSWAAMRNLLAIYGLDLNAAMDSAKASTTSQEGDKATVEVTYTLFGQPQTTTIHMVREDGQWYNAGMLKKFDEAAESDTQVAQSAADASGAGH